MAAVNPIHIYHISSPIRLSRNEGTGLDSRPGRGWHRYQIVQMLDGQYSSRRSTATKRYRQSTSRSTISSQPHSHCHRVGKHELTTKKRKNWRLPTYRSALDSCTKRSGRMARVVKKRKMIAAHVSCPVVEDWSLRDLITHRWPRGSWRQ